MLLKAKIFVCSLILLVSAGNAQVNYLTLAGQRIDKKAGSFQVIADEHKISVLKNGQPVNSINLTGVKTFLFSPSGEKALVVNYSFRRAKENYTITYFLIDGENGLLRTDSVTGYYDMPNPLFTINENGIIGYCDPGSLILTIDNAGLKTDIRLFNDAPYEMERGVFISSDDELIYIAGNLKPVAFELKEDNLFLAVVDIRGKTINKVMLPYLSVESLNLTDGKINLIGYNFTPSFSLTKIILDNTLKILKTGE